MKPYSVEITIIAVVMADSPEDAEGVARDDLRDIISDNDPDFGYARLLKIEDELKRIGWSGECLPYGGDGETRLKDIFATMEAESTPDDKTIDMFAEVK